MAFYHPNRLSCLRVFAYDRSKIYTIIQIELNSIQPIEVVSVVRVICWNNQDDHMETRHFFYLFFYFYLFLFIFALQTYIKCLQY